MIAVSGALVLVAIALLVTGLALPSLVFVYASIGMSLVSAGCLVVGVFAGRGRLFRRGSTAAAGAPGRGGSPSAPVEPGTARAAQAGGSARPAPESGVRPAATGLADAPANAEVVVLPGRPRYHLASCRLVKGRATETLVLAEAREEGYVPCTACRPDAALAARGDRDEEPAPEETMRASDASPGQTAAFEDREAADEDEFGTVESGSASEPPDVAEQAVGAGGSGERPDAVEVTVVPGQRRYHRSGCAVVADAVADGADTTTLVPAEAIERGLTPCTACHPPAD